MKSSIKNSALLVAAVLGVAACGGGSGGSPTPTPAPAPANAAPTISAITNKASDQDTVVTVDFAIQDRESAVTSLTVSATADGTSVFPADGVVLSGTDGTRRLTLTPLESATGTATISLSVADPAGAIATQSFQVAINVKNASMRTAVLDTIAKAENDAVTTINGWTALQDADDPATFAALIPAEEE
jgi:hypothetical protein